MTPTTDEITIPNSLAHVTAALLDLFEREDFGELYLTPQPAKHDLLAVFYVGYRGPVDLAAPVIRVLGEFVQVGELHFRETAADQTVLTWVIHAPEFEPVLAAFLAVVAPAERPQPAPAPAVYLPSRQPHLRRWKRIWRKLKPIVLTKTSSQKELIGKLPADLKCSRETLGKIIRAGEAGLLDGN